MIGLKKDISLPELPDTMRMAPINKERTLYKEINEDLETKQVKKAIEEAVEDNSEKESEVPQEQTNPQVPTIDDVFLNHEERLQLIESALLRIRGAI